MEFQSRGNVETTSGIRFAFYLHVPCTLKNETEIELESVLAWHTSGQLTYTHLTEESPQEELFPYLDEIVYCDHGDRGHIQVPLNLPNFFLFMKASLLTVILNQLAH